MDENVEYLCLEWWLQVSVCSVSPKSLRNTKSNGGVLAVCSAHLHLGKMLGGLEVRSHSGWMAGLCSFQFGSGCMVRLTRRYHFECRDSFVGLEGFVVRDNTWRKEGIHYSPCFWRLVSWCPKYDLSRGPATGGYCLLPEKNGGGASPSVHPRADLLSRAGHGGKVSVQNFPPEAVIQKGAAEKQEGSCARRSVETSGNWWQQASGWKGAPMPERMLSLNNSVSIIQWAIFFQEMKYIKSCVFIWLINVV